MLSTARAALSLFRSFSNTQRLLFASSCSVSEDRKRLKLLCDGEPERRYHGVWLRHNCRCPVCLPPVIQQNIVHHSNLVDLKITDATLQGDSVLVNWQSKEGPHSCSFDVDWLKEHDYTTPQLQRQRIDNEKPLIAKSLPFFDYEEMVSSAEGYYRWMKQINYYGMSLLQNVPTVDMLVEATDSIALPQIHGYDTVYNVKAKEFPSDAAYTSDDLLLHSDQNFFESSPGIQFLFCLQFDNCVEGGESVIVDTLPVLEELREKHPKEFQVLTHVPYITHRQHENPEASTSGTPISLKYSRPHIGLDYNGQINSISWSPQYHSPPLASEKDIEEYYDAFTLLSSMFEESPLKFFHRLQPGEAIVLNNRRVLHSRKAFKLNGGNRHLQGHYINLDFFCSKFRTLSRQLNMKEPIKRMFNRSHLV